MARAPRRPARRRAAVHPAPPTRVGLSVTVGHPFAWGNAVYGNRDRRPLRLLTARPVQLSPGLRMLRVRAAGERRPSIVGLDRSWPPKDFPLSTTDPVNGFEVPPERTRAGRAGVELLFEVVADRPGHYAARGLEIAYEDAGGKRYRDVMPDALGVCALPRGRDPETAPQCPFVGTLPEGKVG